VVLGTLGQALLVPLGTAALILALAPAPILAGGMMLVAAAPGAGVSNVFTHVARGNTALSVTLTAVASVLSVVTLPLIVTIGLAQFADEEVHMDVPVLVMIGQLVLFVLVPIAAGMILRARRPDIQRHGPKLHRVTMVALLFLIAFSITAGAGDMATEIGAAMGPALLWTVGAAAIGVALGLMGRLPERDRFTLMIELSAKNIGLAAVIALSALKIPMLALFCGAYVALAYPLLLGVALLRRRRVA
jgi:BASS family bile acid:Na+ symporter